MSKLNLEKNNKKVWENITKEELWELCVEKGQPDSMIAQIYGVTKGQVAYKRKKMGITQNVIIVEQAIYDPDYLTKANEEAKNTLTNSSIPMLSRAITHYVFRNGPVEDMHSAGKLNDNDMETLNKYINNKLATLIYLLKEDKWFKLLGVIYAFELYGKNWDEPEIEEGEVEEICKEVIRKILSAATNTKNN